MGRVGDSFMIRLDEVAIKLEDILNGTDQELLNTVPSLIPPTGFVFSVATEGFHLDRICDTSNGENFIPVFISSMGGNFNPVPELLQANYVIPITFWFPVRFKNSAYMLNEYIAKAFVGRYWNYGEESGKALSNVSVAQFGEIEDLDVKEFGNWIKSVYRKPIEIMEPFIQMTITLYLSTADEGFVYGNDATATLSITGSSLDPESLVFVQNSIQSSTEPAVQQILGSNESEGMPSGTAYGSSFSVYVKDNNFYKYLLQQWFSGNSQTLSLILTLQFLGCTFTRTVYIQSVNLVTAKGELTTMTFSFAKRIS